MFEKFKTFSSFTLWFKAKQILRFKLKEIFEIHIEVLI